MSFSSWFRKRRFACAGLALYAALAVAVMAPMAPRELPSTPAQDLANHVSGIIEARRALAEGQFPIRVAPDQNQQTRYPIFQFYGNLPYTLGGAAYLLTRANPYTIWKLEVAAFLVLGAFFTYRTARMLTRQPLPALAAGAVFLTAPYVLTDIHGRFAFSEVISFMLLPVVFYWCLRCFSARRLGPILACGVSWSALSLSHNITYLYAAAYFGLFFLTWLVPLSAIGRRLVAVCYWPKIRLPDADSRQPTADSRWPKAVIRCLRVGAGFGLGLALTAWTIVPQQQLVPDLCEGLRGNVFKNNWMTPLGTLLAPAVALPVHLPTIYIGTPEHFGLQIGWPILAAVALTLCYLRSPLARMHGRRALVSRFLVFFGLAFFMSWTPFDFWRALPALFSYAQFSYRLLMFVVLWGSLLAAYALALGLEGRMRPLHLAAVLLGLGVTAGPYLAPHKTEPQITVAQEIAHPEMGRGGAGVAYAIDGGRLAQTTLLHPSVDWADNASGGLLDGMEFYRHGRARAVFPASREGDTLHVEGVVSDDVKSPLRLAILVDNQLIAAPRLPPGPFQLTFPLPPAPAKERVSIAVEGDPILTPGPPPHPEPFRKASYTLKHLSLLQGPGHSDGPRLMPAEAVRPQVKFGLATTLRLQIAEPTLVQLPVVFYPGMLHVNVDGHRLTPQHLGRFVAVELPPGQHVISVRFVGVVWANWLSAATWVGVALTALLSAVRRLGRSRRVRNSDIQRPSAMRATLTAIRALRRAASVPTGKN